MDAIARASAEGIRGWLAKGGTHHGHHGPLTRRVLALAAFIVLIILLGPAAGATAAPSAASGAPIRLGDHVTDCNVTFDAGGNILLDGSALTGAQAALLDALLLTDASLAAALETAADADADACVNLEIDLLAATVTLNADVSACGAVDAVAGGFIVGGVEISDDLLNFERVTEAAALADVDACVILTVTDNDVVIDAIATICAQALWLNRGSPPPERNTVYVFLDDAIVVDFDADLFDAGGLLDVGVAAEVNLTITATHDVAAETGDLTIVVTPCAAGGGATPAPTAAPPGGGGGPVPPGATATPVPGLPDTAAWGGGMGPVAALVALLGLSLVGVVGAHIRRRR